MYNADPLIRPSGQDLHFLIWSDQIERKTVKHARCISTNDKNEEIWSI